MNSSIRFTALVMSLLSVMGTEAFSQTPASDIQLLHRRPKQTTTSRPQVPVYRDYLTYTVSGTVLNIAYPDNSLPATVTVSGADSGFILYSVTALREEPVDLQLEPGDYTLTVTLVDERTYEGTLEGYSGSYKGRR